MRITSHPRASALAAGSAASFVRRSWTRGVLLHWASFAWAQWRCIAAELAMLAFLRAVDSRRNKYCRSDSSPECVLRSDGCECASFQNADSEKNYESSGKHGDEALDPKREW